MEMPELDLRQIVAQAHSLSECLDRPRYQSQNSNADSTVACQRLEHWCEVAAQGDWSAFQKRLDWDDLDRESVNYVLSSPADPAPDGLPPWTDTLKAIIATANQPLPDSSLPIDSADPQPFEDILLPIVIAARQKLQNQLQSSPAILNATINASVFELVSESGYLELEKEFLKTLINLSTKTLDHEFTNFRPLGHNLLNFFAGTQSTEPSKELYYKFVNGLLQDGLLTLFKQYPVLAKLIAIATDFWVESTLEFINYLAEDLPELETLFASSALTESQSNWQSLSPSFHSAGLGQVVSVRPSLSDFHNRGRSAIALTFSSGLKLIYKPKDLGLDVAFFDFLAWCNQQNSPLDFKILKILNRGSHGWVEYVEQQPCGARAAAQRFYQRAGMLLCVLYLLGATDCHYENLIASGEHLVLIDTETLLHPDANPIDGSAVEMVTAATDLQLADSVLRTGLLPNWIFSADNRIAYDLSGLGSCDPQQAPWRLPRWQFINTDEMRLVNQDVTMPLQQNIAVLEGQPLSPDGYLAEILTGFEQMYNLFLEQRQYLQSSLSPLVPFNHQPVRLIFRHTQVYGVILQKSLEPQWLQDGRDRSLQLEGLSWALLACEHKPLAWPLLKVELAAMEQMDIPFFQASTSHDGLEIEPGLVIPRYFQAASYAQVLNRLDKLNPADCTLQLAMIRGSFQARIAHQPLTSKLPQGAVASISDRLPTQTLIPDQFLQEAIRLGHLLETEAIRGKDGSATWLGFDYIANADRFQMVALKDALYEGASGVAVFLAALSRVTNQDRFGGLALGALQPLQKFLYSHDRPQLHHWAKQLGIGGATGLGSIIYALTKISDLLQDRSLHQDALTIAQLITPELIAADQQFDVIGGAAGAILGLLPLYRATGDTSVLTTAQACGQHLLANQEKGGAWKNFAEQPLTGFSHGAAGIALALLQLAAQTGEEVYRQAAIAGISYEQSLFSATAANWPDLRSIVQQEGLPGFSVSWCHGAPGIGLARIGGLDSYATAAIQQEIEIALQTTQKQGAYGLDHLCCGTFGRIELLLVAAERFDRPELQETARYLATQVVTKATEQGGYRLFANLPPAVLNPNFFQGIAGVGYQLLRLTHPNQISSVLLWE
uniref:Lanthionine synthetase C family protein n=1 Tax=Cyanothece sp. (strain PCC 7425 / ATCC 29141) TaxID=395961 RepID=B8HVI2_CYAP4